MPTEPSAALSSDRVEDEALWYFAGSHPRSAAIRRDPYPFFDRLRASAPILEVHDGVWLVSSYEAVDQLLRDSRWSREPGVDVADLRLAERVFLRNVTSYDSPDHERLRRIVAPAFTAAAVRKRRDLVQQAVAERLAAIRVRDRFDFYGDFAFQLPVQIICKLLGVPNDRQDDFVTWSQTMVDAQEPGEHSPEMLQAADDAAVECVAFFGELIEQKRRRPDDSLMTLLVEASDAEQPRLTAEEVVAMCIVLHVGGHETTSNLIANGMYLLDRHPDAYGQLRDDPVLIPNAVEEMLRYEAPARNTLSRRAPEDIELCGQRIVEGSMVYGLLSAAGRDPAIYRDPHRFDVARQDNRHLSFGMGMHFCLGSALVRLETREVFEALAREPRLLRVDDEPAWRDSFIIRGLTSLPVAWD